MLENNFGFLVLNFIKMHIQFCNFFLFYALIQLQLNEG